MENELINFLTTFVSFQSVSSDQTKKEVSVKTAQFLAQTIEKLGGTTLIYSAFDDKNPVVFGRLGEDESKPTVAIYGHYDVQPARLEDGWNTNPFELTERDGYLLGRGASDDKGPISATIYAIKELQNEGELPLNFRFIYEGEEESSSGGFIDAVNNQKNFIEDAQALIVMDTPWFTDDTPSVRYGLRGIAYMGIEIKGPQKDIHSGAGGSFREPMHDLVTIMSKLVDKNGKAIIDGFYDDVRSLTNEEESLYDNLPFDVEKFKESVILVKKAISEDPKTILMNMWRYPSISLHGIEGAFSDPGSKTVIPSKVIGKVSMRLVPDQQPNKVVKLFENQVKILFDELKSPNQLKIHNLGTGDWWVGDFESPLFKTVANELETYWGVKVAFERGGGSIPIVSSMEKILQAPAILIGIGQPSDGAHSQNERIRIKNLVGGKNVLKNIFNQLPKGIR